MLERSFVVDRWHDLAQLDQPAVSAGKLEPWDRDNYLRDVPGKWALSVVSLSDDSRVVGYRFVSLASPVPDCAHSHRLSVAVDHRRRGVASELDRAVRDRAGSLGRAAVTCYCNGANGPVVRFLTARGWTPTGTYRGENQLWMVATGVRPPRGSLAS